MTQSGESMVRAIHVEAARAFITSLRRVIDAMLIEAQRAEETRTPQTRDYNAATLSRETPPGGWIGRAELDAAAQKLAEAIAAEKWIEGMVFAIRFLATVGAV